MASLVKSLAMAALALVPGMLRAEVSSAFFLTALKEGRRQKIVVYGTSLTANSAWPARFESTLRESHGNKLRLINAAGGGKDSRWGLANLNKRVIAEKPDTVFIEFAINDALEQSKLGVSESMANLEEMISSIRREVPFCDVIVMIMNPPTGEALEKRPRIEAYQDGCRRVAARSACRLINFAPLWRGMIRENPALWRSYVPDGLHPNERACREVIVPFLLEKTGYSPPAGNATASL